MDIAKSHIDFPRRRMRRRVSLSLAALVAATYLYAVAVPRGKHGRQVQAGIDALALQRDELADRVHQLDAQAVSESGRESLPRAIEATELLPAVAALSAQAGVLISTAKQIATDRESGESRVRVRATAAFAGIVSLLESLAQASDDIALDDLAIRRRTDGSRPGDLDVDITVALQAPTPETGGIEE